MLSLILCGLPMSGKSTIGKLVSLKLDWAFIDTDRLIEHAYRENKGRKCSCRQILLEEGEENFRELENRQISSLKKNNQAVISIGGGTLNNWENTIQLQNIGYLIYLKSPIDVLWKRIIEKGIPAYLDPNEPEKSFYIIAEKRMPLYEKAANLIIETRNLNENEIAELILTREMPLPLTKVSYGK